MNEHNIVVLCRGEGSQSSAVFNNLIDNKYTTVSVKFHKARVVEVKVRIYTILPDLSDTTDPQIFSHVNLPFDVSTNGDFRRR